MCTLYGEDRIRSLVKKAVHTGKQGFGEMPAAELKDKEIRGSLLLRAEEAL